MFLFKDVIIENYSLDQRLLIVPFLAKLNITRVYIFVVKSKVPNMKVCTIFESKYAAFFDDMFHMKDIPSMSSQEYDTESSNRYGG